jgi:hypothetical protein
VVVPDDGYLAEAQKLLREHNALLICDEVQTGLLLLGVATTCWMLSHFQAYQILARCVLKNTANDHPVSQEDSTYFCTALLGIDQRLHRVSCCLGLVRCSSNCGNFNLAAGVNRSEFRSHQNFRQALHTLPVCRTHHFIVIMDSKATRKSRICQQSVFCTCCTLRS